MKTTKLKIGISMRIITSEYNEKRDALSHDWLKVCDILGIIPILIPNDLSNLQEYLNESEIYGIILSGGEDIGTNTERDETEKALIEYAIKKNIPTLGVCRGMQMLNVFFGGSIIKSSDVQHMKNYHEVKIINKDKDFSLGIEFVKVDSFHNNIISMKNLGQKLEPFAISKNDLTIEGFRHELYPIYGVMWHPERDLNKNNLKILQKIFCKN